MATPPTRVGTAASVWNTTTAPKTVSLSSLTTGDLVVILMSGADGADGATSITPSTTVGSTGAWTQQLNIGTTGLNCRTYIATALVTATSATLTVSLAVVAASAPWGFRLVAYRNHNGVGAIGNHLVSSPSTGTMDCTFTTTGDNSAIEVIAGDWTANSTSPTTTDEREVQAGNEVTTVEFQGNGTDYGVFTGLYADAGAAGSKTVGWSLTRAPGVGAVEIKGIAASATAAGQYGWGTYGAGNYGSGFGASGATQTGAVTIPGTGIVSPLAMVEHNAASSNGGTTTVTAATSVERGAVSTIAAVSTATIGGYVERRAASTIAGATSVTGSTSVERRAASTSAATSNVVVDAKSYKPYPALVTSFAGLMGYWRLGESSGSVATDELGARNGTYNNITYSAPSAIVNDSDTGVGFNGATGTNVTIANAPTPTSAITISAWVAPGGGDGNARIVDRPNTVTASPFSDWALESNAGGDKWAFEYTANSTGVYLESLTPMAIGYSHIVATFDGTTSKIYVNGTLDNSLTSPGALSDRGMPLRFGAYGPDSTIVRFAGNLDEVSIWNRALSGSEISALFSTGSGSGDELGIATVNATSATSFLSSVEHPASATVAGATTVSATTAVERRAQATIPATSLVAVSGIVEHRSSSTIPATSSVAVAGIAEHNGSSAIIGATTTNIVASVEHNASASIAALSVGTFTAQKTANGIGNIPATTTVSAAAFVEKQSASTILGQSVVVADTSVERRASSGIAGQSSIAADGTTSGLGYPAAVRADAPKAYWQLGANSSTQPEDQGGPNLILNGATPNVTGATTALGPAVSFDGVNDYGRVASLDLSTADKITIEMWLSWDTNGSDDSLALEHGESNQIKGFAIDPSSSSNSGSWTTFSPNATGSEFAEERMTTRPSAATWHHVVVTIDRTALINTGNVFDFYLDGVHDAGLVTSNFQPDGLFQNYPLMVMGRSAASDGTKSLFGAGDMQHLAIYDTILSATRVQAHYDARNDASISNPSATIPATSIVSAVAQVDHAATAAINATSNVVADGYSEVQGSSVIAALGSVTAFSVAERRAASTIAAQSSVNSSGFVERQGAASIAGQTSVTAGGYVEHNALASIAGLSSVTATGRPEHNASTSISGLANVVAGASMELRGSVVIGATSTTTGSSHTSGIQAAAATIAAQGLPSPSASVEHNAQAATSAASAGSLSGYVERLASISINALSGGTADSRVEHAANAILVSGSIVSMTPFKQAGGVATIASSSSVSAAANKDSQATATANAQSGGLATGSVEANSQAIIGATGNMIAGSSMILSAAATINAQSDIRATTPGKPVSGVAILRSWSTVSAKVGQIKPGVSYVSAHSRVTADGVVVGTQAKIDSLSNLMAAGYVIPAIARQPRRVFSGTSGVRGSRVSGGVK